MLKDRDNLIGVLFLVLMLALAGILLRAIATGERVTMDLPGWASAALAIGFFVLIFVGLRRSGLFGGGGGGRHWPDPQTGRRGRSLWDRIRGR